MAYTVHSPGQAVQSLSMPCIFCDATGKITEQRRSALRAEAALWCRCEDNEAGTQYVADGAGIIAKHHWVCLHCGKIVQIG
ncbi:MAG: hypothetical protein E6Q76_14305 [Rhizobium sp.]|nr:MAG: hypothetical protein E6Q76_14305 [Rhizobium sp.]